MPLFLPPTMVGNGLVSPSGDPNLVGWWKLDESSGLIATDSSGNGNDGTFNDTPIWTTGHIGGAADFNGKKATITDQTNFNFSVTDPFSISIWVMAKSVGTMVGKYNVLQGYKLNIEDWEYIQFLLMNYDGSEHKLELLTNFFTNPTSGWFHVAVTYDGSGFAAGTRIYVNGVSSGSVVNDDISGRVITIDTPLILGSDAWGQRVFQGAMDDIRIYNKELSPTEVADLAAM